MIGKRQNFSAVELAAGPGHDPSMGFNRRKMEDQRRQGGQQMARGVDFDVFTGE